MVYENDDLHCMWALLKGMRRESKSEWGLGELRPSIVYCDHSYIGDLGASFPPKKFGKLDSLIKELYVADFNSKL